MKGWDECIDECIYKIVKIAIILAVIYVSSCGSEETKTVLEYMFKDSLNTHTGI